MGIDEMKISKGILGKRSSLSEYAERTISNFDYAPTSAEKRIGVAAGKFAVPNDSYFYDDEIAELFD